jgi:hypothetical protein
MGQAENVLREMVRQSVDGVFHGSPRDIMEDIGASSGTLYKKLRSMGLEQKGKGKDSVWVIPKSILSQFGK